MRAPLLSLLLLAPAAWAQSTLPEPLPPPALDDPGVQAPAPTPPAELDDPVLSLPPEPAPAAPAEAPRSRSETDRLTGGSRSAADLRAQQPEDMTVSIRTLDNGDVVEEYRTGGQVSMVRVTPARGVPYTLMDTTGNGRIDRVDGENRVSPVLYTLYEWE